MRPALSTALALLVAAATAFAAGGFTPSSGPLGTTLLLRGFGFPPIKKPRALLLPQSGQTGLKKVEMKVLAYSEDQIDVQVVRGRAGVYGIALLPAERRLAPVSVDGTFEILGPRSGVAVPGTAFAGEAIEIAGEAFGAKKGRVTVGGKTARVLTWNEGSVSVIVPRRLAPGPQDIVVTTKAGSSEPIAFTVAAP